MEGQYFPCNAAPLTLPCTPARLYRHTRTCVPMGGVPTWLPRCADMSSTTFRSHGHCRHTSLGARRFVSGSPSVARSLGS